MPVNLKCQVFTPSENVKQLLDSVEYTKNLYGKKIAENSCGDGSILVKIVERYINDSIKNKIDIKKIKKGLEKDIWGAEIDSDHVYNCRAKLDEVAALYGLTSVKWNIYIGDFLKENIVKRFDFVIGNPPYITYKELDITNRKFLRETFETCADGKFDYYYAFIEASIKSLKDTGKLAYLIPSNIFKNRFALNLRNYILPKITDIYDYTNQKLFAGKLTSSAIIVCDMSNKNKNIKYHNLSDDKKFIIEKKSLSDKWIFKEQYLTYQKIDTVKFGEYFHAANSIATLLNEVYIISDFIDGDTYIQVKNQQIEKELLREAVSPRSLNHKKKEYIIFPYYYTREGLQKYSEKEFQKKFPCAVSYLCQFKKKLNERNNDKGINWYEYGRSQALPHLDQKKLLISTIITGSVRVTMLNKHVIPTSGIYITLKKNQNKYTLSTAKEILHSNLFLEYVKGIGIISNGKSYRISSKDINNFTFPKNLLVDMNRGREYAKNTI